MRPFRVARIATSLLDFDPEFGAESLDQSRDCRWIKGEALCEIFERDEICHIPCPELKRQTMNPPHTKGENTSFDE